MNIVQVGLGTSGSITALILSKFFPKHNFKIVHNSKIIGVGEATFENFRTIISLLDLDEDDFLKHCGGTLKFGIGYKNFIEKENSFFHPFSYGYNGYRTTTDFHFEHHSFRGYSLKGEEYSNKEHPLSKVFLDNRVPLEEDGVFSSQYAFHINTQKFNEYCLTLLSKRSNVEIISDDIIDIKINHHGIDKLMLKNGNIITGDLFLDCSGFSQLLRSKLENAKWISIEKDLPNNKAFVIRQKYKNELEEIHPYTKATAMSHGWMWSIPLIDEISHGYVFSDLYSDYNEIHDEMEKHFSIKIKDYNQVNFKSGYEKVSWYKNCCALGLSSAFIEPLESTGIAIFIEQAIRLSTCLEKGYIKQLDRDFFNYRIEQDVLNIKTFIKHHFLHTQREDTNYWRDWKYDRSLTETEMDQWYNLYHSHVFPEEKYTFFTQSSYESILRPFGVLGDQNKFLMKYNSQSVPSNQLKQMGMINTDKISRFMGFEHNKEESIQKKEKFEQFIQMYHMNLLDVSSKLKRYPKHFEFLTSTIYR